MKRVRPPRAPRARVEAAPACWCGNRALVPFSPAYLRCLSCETLRVARMPVGLKHVKDDDRDFYGRTYWFAHQERDLNYPDITARARMDLPERGLHWLRTVLKHKLPPARALEIGCSHGGFVALLGWAGFDAQGLELSPWVVEYARRTFDVPVLLGPLEAQDLDAGSLDLIVLMDVLEHLHDPVATLRRALELMKPDGIIVIQTPRYAEARTHEEMVAANDPFLEHLKADEHLHLFSPRSIAQLLHRVGAVHLAFEPAIFAQYDMCVVAGRQPLHPREPTAVGEALESSADKRLVRALIDLNDQLADLKRRYASVETDRAARLEVLLRQADELSRIPSLKADVAFVKRQFETAEADRRERLRVIEKQSAELTRIPKLEADTQFLRKQLTERLAVIERQGADLGRIPGLEADIQFLRKQLTERLAVIERQGAKLARIPGLEADIEFLQKQLAERLAVIERQGAELARIPGFEADMEFLRKQLAEHLELLRQRDRQLAALTALLEEAHPATRLGLAWPAELKRVRLALDRARACLAKAPAEDPSG